MGSRLRKRAKDRRTQVRLENGCNMSDKIDLGDLTKKELVEYARDLEKRMSVAEVRAKSLRNLADEYAYESGVHARGMTKAQEERNRALGRLRLVAQILICEFGEDCPMDAENAAKNAVSVIKKLRQRVASFELASDDGKEGHAWLMKNLPTCYLGENILNAAAEYIRELKSDLRSCGWD